MASPFSVGVKVRTHSLSATKYNGLSGTVTGAETVNTNNVTRVPVSLQLLNGSKKIMLLQPYNLTIIAANTSVFSSNDGINLENQFYDAVRDGDVDKVRVLAKRGVDINKPTDNGIISIPIHLAAYVRNEGMIRVLAELGAVINILDSNGAIPLHAAAYLGDVEIIRVFVELGAFVNSRDSIGCTPVYVAALKGNVKAIRVLVELGADINIFDRNGKLLHTLHLSTAKSMLSER
jgi:ankyrin repeat protein